MRNVFLFGLWLLIANILSSCSTGKEAQILARATLSQTLSYEDQVNNKIKAEKSYYQKSANALRASIGRSENINQLSILDRSVQTAQNVATSSQKDLEPIDITNYIDKLLNDMDNNRKVFLSATKEYNDDLQNNLIALDKKKSSLKTITTGLEKLQADPSEAEQLKVWFKFAKDVKADMDKKDTTVKTN
jgi:uncharacterized membrane protein YgaE (UPF0421/DUF939 family)